jgi:endonuclease/exonuclease/phosphatase family metal-dependent hydrolase
LKLDRAAKSETADENQQEVPIPRQTHHLGIELAVGENRRILGLAAYGNAVLSRFPIRSRFNYDLTVAGRDSRGCFRTEVHYSPSCRLQVLNVHLGTAFLSAAARPGPSFVSSAKTTEQPPLTSFWATSTSGQEV